MRPMTTPVAWVLATLMLAAGTTAQITQQAYIKASNTDASDRFSWSVAMSGNTVVVGALGEDSSSTGVDGDEGNNRAEGAGATYVFVRGGAQWTQQAYVKASNAGAGDQFGISVSISGDTLVVGATGEASAATGVNGEQTDDGAVLAGAAYVFVRNGSTWTQQAYLKASNTDAGDLFGSSVSIYGNTLVVGAQQESSGATGVDGDESDDSELFAGAAYVFVRDGTTWTQQAYLKASNTDQLDRFGQSVALLSDTLVVGASFEDSAAVGVDGDEDDDTANSAGAVYVFVRDGTTWSQQAYLKASNAEQGDRFGQSVAVAGDMIVVGAHLEDSAAVGVDGNGSDNGIVASGAAYVFSRTGNRWSQQAYLKASNTDQSDGFGIAVAAAPDTVLVGAYLEDSDATGIDGDQGDASAGVNSGATYLFSRNGTSWSQQAYLKASNPTRSDQFGQALAISTDTIVIGAREQGSDETGIYGDGDPGEAESSGAVYVFDAGQAECLLVVGDGPGSATHFGLGHVFETQLDGIEDAYDVLLDDIPEFVLPVPMGRRDSLAKTPGSGLLSTVPLGDVAPEVTPTWMLDGDFAVQVLMWNPEVFPGLPEQYTAGLYVSIQPDGSVFTAPYGDDVGGMAIWHELDTNAAGQRVIRFPFSIPGF